MLISIPSVHDPGLAPPGHMVLHAYTPATERFDRWAGLDRASAAYRALKAERAAYLWQAAVRVVCGGVEWWAVVACRVVGLSRGTWPSTPRKPH